MNKDVDFHEHENLYKKILMIDNNHFLHRRIKLDDHSRRISVENK
jgi:hypothetical protein